jgi:hypothetical protein
MTTLRTGARVPFFSSDITHYHALATTDFSPIEDAGGTFSATQTDVFIKNGFIVFNATDTAGLVYVITWEEFQTHRQESNKSLVSDSAVLALCTPVAVYIPSGGAVFTPVVKVFAGDTQGAASTVTHINIGTIR